MSWPALDLSLGDCCMFDTPSTSADKQQFEHILLETLDLLPESSKRLFYDLNTFKSSNSFVAKAPFEYFLAPEKAQRNHGTHFEHSSSSGALNQESSSTNFLTPATQLEPREISDYGHSSSNDNSTMAPPAELSSQTEQNTLHFREPSMLTQPKQPSRSIHGKLTCSHSDCKTKDLIFSDIRAWKKHENKHNRPFRCTIANCTRTQGFTSKGDQLRHEHSVHKQGIRSANTMLFCDEPSCERGTGQVGFARRDNLIDHVKRRHGRVLLPARTSVSDSMLPDTQSRTEIQEVESILTVPESQKPTDANTPETLDTFNIRATKRPTAETCGSTCETERTPREEALSRENEQLRRELEKAQKEKDVLITVICRLTLGQE